MKLKISVLLHLILLFSFAPARASAWRDVTAELSKILGSPVPGEPVYLRTGSLATIKSSNFKGYIYKRGIFSYLVEGNFTARKTFMFNCKEANYKNSETGSGDWMSVDWITPDSPKDLTWAIYKFLCPGAKDPWIYVVSSKDGSHTYFNSGTGYRFNSRRYGEVVTWVTYTSTTPPPHIKESEAFSGKGVIMIGDSLRKVANRYGLSLIELLRLNPGIEASRLVVGSEIRTSGQVQSMRDEASFGRVFISCKKNLSQWHDLESINDSEIELSESNPGSVGSGIHRVVCGK